MTQIPEPEQTSAADKSVASEAAYPYRPQSALLPKPQFVEPWEDIGPPTYLPEAMLVGGCLAFNGIAPMLISAMRGEPIALIALTMGVVWAETAVLCTVLVFGESPFWRRLGAVWAVGYAPALCFLGGIVLVEGPPGTSEPLRVLFCGLPLVALAAQLPLWATRSYLGWRLVRPLSAIAPPRPLSIGDILCGTAIVAATVGLARFMPDNGSVADLPMFWLGCAVAVGAAAGISLISVPPALYLMLRVEQRPSGCMGLAIYAVVAAVATLIIISVVAQQAPPGEVIVVFPLMIGAYAAALGGVFSLARWRGYRLVFPSDQWSLGPPAA